MTFSTFMAGLVVGLIPLVIAGWLWRRKKAQLEADNAQIEADREEQAKSFRSTQHSRDLQELEHGAQSKLRLAELRNTHREKISELHTTHQQEFNKLRTTQAENLELVRAQLARGMQWEETSRLELARVCHALGVNGFLATNVCFLAYNPQSRPYIHQIDHLIVSDQMLFVVEAKHWEGTIYHREQPANGRDQFSIDALPMLRHVGPRERYVLRMKDNGSMFWLPRDKSPEPVKQVQTQSVKFREFLQSKLGKNPGETFNCVFYSHPDSTLTGGARPLGKYTWITQTRELPNVLKRMQHQRSSTNTRPVDVEAIHEIVWSLGADILGLGTYAEKWRSPLPLGHKTEVPDE